MAKDLKESGSGGSRNRMKKMTDKARKRKKTKYTVSGKGKGDVNEKYQSSEQQRQNIIKSDKDKEYYTFAGAKSGPHPAQVKEEQERAYRKTFRGK